MAHAGSAELKGRALELMRSLGFGLRGQRLPGCRSRNVYCYDVDGNEEFILIQCRSYQSDTDRYLVGIIMEALFKVDSVFLYFDRECKAIKFPANFLRRIHEERVVIGDASYTGSHNEQWRVDLYLSDEQLSPQGSSGRRYDIGSYVIKIEPNKAIESDNS